jgi:hypothetical protein
LHELYFTKRSLALLLPVLLLSFRSAAEESAFVAVVALVVVVASSCRHPEQSEGPRRTSLTPIAGTFSPTRSNVVAYSSPQHQETWQLKLSP